MGGGSREILGEIGATQSHSGRATHAAMERARPSAQAASDLANAAPSPVNPVDAPSSEAHAVAPDADVELVARARAGDRAAFRTLFDRYNRRAYGVAFGVVKNQQDAADVVQEAFIKVHRHLDGFQGNSSFYTWLYRIVMNLSIDHLRRKKKVTEFDETVRKDDALADGATLPQSAHENPAKAVARKELTDQLHAALAELPEYHRAVIVLREVEGLSYEEMAKILKVPKGTIMSRLFHARRKMQERLVGYLDGDLKVTE
jgi:RNA polymerase sigma-70 factor (ECF subfamily)